MPAFATPIQHSIGNPSHSSQTRKRNEGHQNWKGGSKTLFADDMIVYIENPIDSTKKLVDLINEFCQTVGYKVNTQNQRHSCISTMKHLKQKSGKKSHLI